MLQTIINQYRNVGIVIDINPAYRRVLRCDGACVDITRMPPEIYRGERWTEVSDELGPLKFAHTFTRSTIPKTERATKLMEQIMKDSLKRLTLTQLNAEYRRVTHAELGFRTKDDAIRAIRAIEKVKLPGVKVKKVEVPSGPMGRPPTKATPEKLERSRKIAAMEKGVGGLIVALLKAGKDNDAAASAALKKFPQRPITPAYVAWYRSMLRVVKVKGV